MSKRKSNKQVKAMIVAIMDEKSGVRYPYGHYYLVKHLCVCFIGGWWPDEYYEDVSFVRFGTVSIKVNETK